MSWLEQKVIQAANIREEEVIQQHCKAAAPETDQYKKWRMAAAPVTDQDKKGGW